MTVILLFPIILSVFLGSAPIVAQQSILIREEKEVGEYTSIVPNETQEEVVLIREDPEIRLLKKQAEEREEQIQKTEKAIEVLNKQLGEISKEKQTLQNQLHGLTLTEKRNAAQLSVTEGNIRIGKTTLQRLTNSIGNNEENIRLLRRVLTENYQKVNEIQLRTEEAPIVFNPTLFETLQYLEEVHRYSSSLSEHLTLLKKETNLLEENKETIAKERIALERKQKELEDRKRIYEFSIQEKKVLVNKTKNNEDLFQELLLKKQEERLKLQQELYEYESKIEYLQDPESVPKPKPGLLRIPFNSSPRVTQLFGQTSFAKANALRYGRPFHDGLDFGITSGTEIVASGDGVIVGIGNTDIVSTCQSWGKWILIEHPFGLSTLYAHLSLQKVRLGQKVQTGELIGYSGNTGFSTGPHLHFGVYDAKGIEVVPYERVASSARCRGLLVPVAPLAAKLDPAEYLAF